MMTHDPHSSYNSLWRHGKKELKWIITRLRKFCKSNPWLHFMCLTWTFLCKLIFWRQRMKWVRGAGPFYRRERGWQWTSDGTDSWVIANMCVLCFKTILRRPLYQKLFPNSWLKWQLTATAEGFGFAFRKTWGMSWHRNCCTHLPLSQSDQGGVCGVKPNGNGIR